MTTIKRIYNRKLRHMTDNISTIEKKTYIPFMGGRIILTPAGTFTRDNGEVVSYEDSIKVEGLGPYPIKLTAGVCKAIVANYKSNKTFSGFVDSLSSKEALN